MPADNLECCLVTMKGMKVDERATIETLAPYSTERFLAPTWNCCNHPSQITIFCANLQENIHLHSNSYIFMYNMFSQGTLQHRWISEFLHTFSCKIPDFFPTQSLRFWRLKVKYVLTYYIENTWPHPDTCTSSHRKVDFKTHWNRCVRMWSSYIVQEHT